MMYKPKKKQERGITLIALVITIIVLLILAGITIAALTGDNGILIKATSAREKNAIAQEKEYISVAWNSAKAEKLAQGKKEKVTKENLEEELKKLDSNTEVKDGEEDNLIAVYNATKREYTITQSGVIKTMMDKNTNIKTDFETGEEVLNVPHTLSYDANEGTGTVESQSGTPDEKITVRENGFTRTGYTFTGWNTNAQGSGTGYLAGAEIQISEDTTLYAQWSRNAVTLSFNANEGTGTMEDVSVGVGVEYTLPQNTFTRDGYIFKGWKLNNTGSTIADNGKITISDNATLYAQWAEMVTVSLNSNDGTNSVQEIRVEKNSRTNLPFDVYSREGYLFLGWDEDENFSTEITESNLVIPQPTYYSYNHLPEYSNRDIILPSSDVTLYAQWLPYDYQESMPIGTQFYLDGYLNTHFYYLGGAGPDYEALCATPLALDPPEDDGLSAFCSWFSDLFHDVSSFGYYTLSNGEVLGGSSFRTRLFGVGGYDSVGYSANFKPLSSEPAEGDCLITCDKLTQNINGEIQEETDDNYMTDFQKLNQINIDSNDYYLLRRNCLW